MFRKSAAKSIAIFQSILRHSLFGSIPGFGKSRLKLQRTSLFISLAILLSCVAGCRQKEAGQLLIYCAVDEPYASEVFADFEKQTGILVTPQYDIESSKSVGLAGKLEAEAEHPRADVWWGSEAFLSVRLTNEGILQPYRSPNAAEIPAQFKDADGNWTGVGLRARVLAVSTKSQPPFTITGIRDLIDPRLKGKVVMSRPTAGATGAHLAMMYSVWGEDKAQAFCKSLHDNGLALVGGNAEVADQIALGNFSLGITDSDDCVHAIENGGKLTMVVPDQTTEGTLAMPTTVGLVKGSRHVDGAKKLIDFIVSRQAEKKLIDLKFAKWSVRGGDEGGTLKSIPVDYAAAAKVYARARQEATAILEGRELK